jgi:hypothetical protein
MVRSRRDWRALQMAGGAISIECFLKGAGQEHLREGWSEIHADTWTLGHRATVEFPPAESGSAFSLTLEIAGIAGPAASAVQRIIVSVNDLRIADVLCRGAQKLEFFVPNSVLQPGRPVQVTFDLPHACRPIDFGHNNDTRLLALRVVRIIFAPLPLPAFAKSESGERDRIAQRDVLLQVHSLGINCEVGFLQRKAGAEPLGLFRWTTAPLHKLVRAMEQSFKGLGAPGTLNIQIDRETEFIVRDSVYNFQYHSFVYANRGGTLEAVTNTEYNRLTYLSRALLGELRAAKKLFTYHDGGQSGLEDIRKLVRAMNQYGRNTLLWIVQAPPGAEPSVARALEPGLIQAYVTGFQLPVDQVLPTSPHQDSWMRAILQGYAIWQSQLAKDPVSATTGSAQQ